jgi:hypothetical protein
MQEIKILDVSAFLTPYNFIVTFFSLWSSPFFILLQINYYNDTDFQGIVNDFTPEMFTVQDIEVLGTPLVTDVYVRDLITRDVQKLELLTDDFTHFQLIQKTMNTRTQYMSANITLSSQEQFLSEKHVHVKARSSVF